MPFQRDIAILGGCGNVGLPLGLAFAERGLTVALHDINASAVETVGQGRMPFREKGADTLLPQLLEAGRLTVTTDAAVLGTAETWVVLYAMGVPLGWAAAFVIESLGQAARSAGFPSCR